MFGTLPVCVALLVSMVPVPPDPKPMEPAAFLAACKAQESALSKFFADENNWKPERKTELLVTVPYVGLCCGSVLELGRVFFRFESVEH